MNQVKIEELSYAEDIVITAESERNLQHNLEIFNQELKIINMKLSQENTKTILISREDYVNKLHWKG